MESTPARSKDERIPNANMFVEFSSAETGTLAGRMARGLLSANSGPSVDEMQDQLARDLVSEASVAFTDEDPVALLDIHKVLYMIYELSFANPLDQIVMHEHSPWVSGIRLALENAWLTSELSHISEELPTGTTSPSQVCDWFERQSKKESALDRRVVGFLANEATLDHFTAFILSDAYLNFRFFDALVLAQLHYSETAKAELIRHTWDETGSGNPVQAHTRQFSRTLTTIGREVPSIPIWNDWRPYAGYNLYFLFGLNRRHYFKALGSLAMPELFDPNRDRAVIAGLQRLGFQAEKDFEYYNSHIEGDEDHGPSWLEHVIKPVVELQPEAATDLAIGAAFRMAAMSRYNEYLADRFGLVGNGVNA